LFTDIWDLRHNCSQAGDEWRRRREQRH